MCVCVCVYYMYTCIIHKELDNEELGSWESWSPGVHNRYMTVYKHIEAFSKYVEVFDR